MAALALAPTIACAPATPPARPNVLLITLDTVRADRLACYGNPRNRTPSLDALAAEGTLFEQAFTPIPSTLPSHCSIMTGTYPGRHGVHDNGVYVLDDSATTLAERLHEAGYATGAFVSAFVLDHQFRLDQGFDTYDDALDLPLAEGDAHALPDSVPEGQRRWFAQLSTAFQRRAEAVTRPALDWLAQRAGEPFFLWVHYFDAHAPYDAPPPYTRMYDPDYAGPMDGSAETWHAVQRRRAARGQEMDSRDWNHMVARHDGEISYLDEWLGHLLDGVREAGVWDETVVVVVGDHGESFGIHQVQTWEHNSALYDDVVHVPLIVRDPRSGSIGQRRSGLVRTIDVAPTVLDLLGLAPWEGIQGTSLVPMLRDPAAKAPDEILLEARRETQIFEPKRSYLGLRTERYKLIVAFHGEEELQTELYDVSADAQETRSLTESSPDVTARLKEGALEAHRATFRDTTSERGLTELDSAALRALGYTDD